MPKPKTPSLNLPKPYIPKLLNPQNPKLLSPKALNPVLMKVQEGALQAHALADHLLP